MIGIDLLIRNIRELVTAPQDDLVRGRDLNSLKISRQVCLASCGETICFIGTEKDFERQCRLTDDAQVIDGADFVVLPGLVDPHTHLPFAGTRQDEFRQKLQGVTYQEIARQGGGIKRSVKQTREITSQELVSVCEQRLNQILLSGTTTLEAKSGYGLERDAEIKQLEAIAALNAIHPLEIVPTFLGAHDIPAEFAGRNREYLDYLLNEVLPVIKAKNLAEFVDIFCEQGFFSYAEAEYYLTKAKQAGFGLKVHADEFTSNQAVLLAVNLGAISAEHMIAMNAEEIAAIAASDTAGIFLPGVSFFMRLKEFAPARRLIEQNGIVALGTDFNPGSSMISSQLFIFQLAVFQLGLTIEEALNAVTINAAYAINRSQAIGSIALGKSMDILLLDIPDYSYLAYHLGINPVHTVIKSGEIVVQNRQLI